MALFKKEISKIIKELKDILIISFGKENKELVLEGEAKCESIKSGKLCVYIKIDIYKDNQTREKIKNLTDPCESMEHYLGGGVNIHDIIKLRSEILELDVSFTFHNQCINEPEQIEICNKIKSEFGIMIIKYFNLIRQRYEKEFFKFILPFEVRYNHYENINHFCYMLKYKIEKLMKKRYPKDTAFHKICVFLGQNPKNKKTYITISSGTYNNTDRQTETIVPFEGANLVLILTGGVADECKLILDKQFNNIKKLYSEFLLCDLEPVYYRIKSTAKFKSAFPF